MQCNPRSDSAVRLHRRNMDSSHGPCIERKLGAFACWYHFGKRADAQGIILNVDTIRNQTSQTLDKACELVRRFDSRRIHSVPTFGSGMSSPRTFLLARIVQEIERETGDRGRTCKSHSFGGNITTYSRSDVPNLTTSPERHCTYLEAAILSSFNSVPFELSRSSR